jgi:hypothetical protein
MARPSAGGAVSTQAPAALQQIKLENHFIERQRKISGGRTTTGSSCTMGVNGGKFVARGK